MTTPPKPVTENISKSPTAASNGEQGSAVMTYRARGLHFFHHSHNNDDHGSDADADDLGAIAGSWWGDRSKESTRPWHNPPRRRKTVPPDQTVAYERTKDAVAKAATAVLGTLKDVGHEALIIAGDALQLAPIMGLAEAARVLLSIWDSVEAVETNRMSCLRLTERCATILYSIRAEIEAAGSDVEETLREPVQKLTESFRRVEHFIQKQVSRPFLKRYLKREEDARKIWACDASLTDSVGLFGLAIQIRMLKEVHAQGQNAEVAVGNEREVLKAIATIRAAQAAHDTALDTADLYAGMRAALRMGSDAAILDVLQIKRGELAEAMKTLQRALEDPRLSPRASPKAKAFPAPQAPDALGLTQSSETDSLDWVPVQAYGVPAPHTPVSTPTTWDPEQDAAFHREFLESGLDALRRISGGAAGESLPPWTITRWEVDREGRIGVGFFSDVFKGVWRGRQVAIKILAPMTPRKLFQHETAIWASLKHPHVLELLGASSATGDPPWFFVSPYMKNGTLDAFLKVDMERKPGVLQMMHEIAVGMAYLHRKDVLHGDLKANNVLIDDDLRCVISDFGQSEMRSEVYRLSHEAQPRGTLRWQAPEIISGTSGLTPAVDVYAFAIVCIEVMTGGHTPWPQLDDTAVQQLVLRHNHRPQIPLRPETSLALVTLIEQCWARTPSARPPFDSVARGLGHLVGGLRGAGLNSSPSSKVLELIREEEGRRVSPDLAPLELPVTGISDSAPELTPTPQSRGEDDNFYTPVSPSTIPLQRVVTPSVDDPDSLRDYPLHDETLEGSQRSKGSRPSTASRAPLSEVFTSTPDNSSEADYRDLAWDGYESPPPRDERIAARRNERRYRLLLQHEFNPSLNLPLWDPTPVALGAVGYLSKPAGTFVSLFNAFNPSSTGLPSIYGYGSVREASLRQGRTFARRGLDIIQGLLTFKIGGSGDGTFLRSVTRRQSFPLRAGHKHAYLCTGDTVYKYMINMNAAKAWFKANIKEILRLYGVGHNIQREDVFLVIGTLETHDWGLFVSHEHPDGQVHFNVYTERKEGQEWGSFSTDTDLSPGPVFDPDVPTVHASKISRVEAEGDADVVLLARLRFKPDVDEPTRL